MASGRPRRNCDGSATRASPRLVRQGHDWDCRELGLAAQALHHLHGLAATHCQVDNNRVGVATLNLNASVEAGLDSDAPEPVVIRQQFAQTVDKPRFGADNQDPVRALVVQFAKGHAVRFKEADEFSAENTAVLAARDAVSVESAGVEPLANRTG